MAQFVEFLGNHWLLSTLWLITFGAIIVYHQRTGSASLSPQQAIMKVNREDAIVVDVRDKKEFDTGHIVDAINIPFSKLKQRVAELQKYQQKPAIVVCKMGQQSGDAAKILQEAGHGETYRLAGGISEWKAQTLPLVQGKPDKPVKQGKQGKKGKPGKAAKAAEADSDAS